LLFELEQRVSQNYSVPLLISIPITIGILALLLLAGGVPNHVSIPAYGFIALAGLICLLPSKNNNPNAVALHCTLSAITFATIVLLRGLTSTDAYIARADIDLVLAALIIYLIFSLVLQSSRRKTQLVILLLVVAFGNVVIGGIQFFKGQNFMPFDFLPRQDYGARASGFFRCPNFLAGFLEIAMLFGLSFAVWGPLKLLGRIASGYIAAVSVMGIILTGSRGGYASAAAGLLVFAGIWVMLTGKRSRKERWYFKGICALILIVGLGFVLNHSLRKSEFLEHRVESTNADLEVRTGLATAALRQFQLNPLFGTGSRTYLYYGREFRNPLIQRDPIFTHNDYLQLLAEYGLIGALAFALFLGFHLKAAWKTMSEAAAAAASPGADRPHSKRNRSKSSWRSAWRSVTDEEDRRDEQRRPTIKRSHALALTIAAFCSVAAYMVHSLVDFNLHIPANACVMAFVFAILASPGNVLSGGKQAQPQQTVAKWLPYAQKIPAALGVWLIAAALPTWPSEYHADNARRLLSDWRMLESPEYATKADFHSRKGLGYDAKNPELYYYLGEAHILLADFAEDPNDRKRHYEESITAYKNALSLSPRDVRFLILLGPTLDAIGRHEEAEQTLVDAIKLDPNWWKVHAEYGAHLEMLNRLEEAETEHAAALKLGNTAALAERLQRVRKRIESQKTTDPAPPAGQ
jgi:O-antigen ligase